MPRQKPSQNIEEINDPFEVNAASRKFQLINNLKNTLLHSLLSTSSMQTIQLIESATLAKLCALSWM